MRREALRSGTPVRPRVTFTGIPRFMTGTPYSIKTRTPCPRSQSCAALPPQILVALALAAAEVGAPGARRTVAEEWVACLVPASGEGEGHDKAVEVYCMILLPAPDKRAYAAQFLEYKTELPATSRGHLIESFVALRTRHERGSCSCRRPGRPKPDPTSTLLQPSTSSAPLPAADATPTPSHTASPTLSSSSVSNNLTRHHAGQHTAARETPPHRRIRLHSTKKL
ncbi:hypothetical protein BC834DRAFT_848338 [Gloeopeniophorella convolvens]|nr:hypothetical protein BC834DRAFT_848338 [Gloeopeniophorella convolvens]